MENPNLDLEVGNIIRQRCSSIVGVDRVEGCMIRSLWGFKWVLLSGGLTRLEYYLPPYHAPPPPPHPLQACKDEHVIWEDLPNSSSRVEFSNVIRRETVFDVFPRFWGVLQWVKIFLSCFLFVFYMMLFI